MNLGYHFQHQILWQRTHGRPVFNIRTKVNLHRRICHSFAVKDTILIDLLIKEVFRVAELYIQIRCGCQISLVGCCRSNGTGIHQCHRRDLAILQLGTFTVREVSGGMTDTETIIGRRITCTETRSAECGLKDCSGLHQHGCGTIFNQFHINRHGCRVNA